MKITEVEIKKIILDIAELTDTPDNLDNYTSLADLGFDDNMSYELSVKLNNCSRNSGKGKVIKKEDITIDSTVQEIIILMNEID